jgi:hypothetical protein
MPRRFLVLLVAVAVSASCGGDSAGPSGTPQHHRVLFLGSSFITVNGLPQMIEALAAASGEDIDVESFTQPGATMEDLWDRDDARALVQNGGFDVVIMQQGPSSTLASRENLREFALKWNDDIRVARAVPGMLTSWPEKFRMAAFPDVTASYRLAAQDIHGFFFPAAETWLETWAFNPAIEMYGSDGFNPSVSGSYAVAVLVVAVVTGRKPSSLAAEMHGSPIFDLLDRRAAADIRAAAEVVLRRYPHQPFD